MKKEFAPEGANSFSEEPMTIKTGSEFEIGKIKEEESRFLI